MSVDLHPDSGLPPAPPAFRAAVLAILSASPACGELLAAWVVLHGANANDAAAQLIALAADMLSLWPADPVDAQTLPQLALDGLSRTARARPPGPASAPRPGSAPRPRAAPLG